jgi:hypothetical protein
MFGGNVLKWSGMSVDGPGLFADDHAFDVRALYRNLVGEGKTGAEATDLLIKEWNGLLDDPDIGPVFWLALAATQWKLGRLEPRVLVKALQIIDDGSDLRRWRVASDLGRRKKVLDNLRRQLVSAQPAPKTIKPTDRVECEWEVGEVFAFKLKSNKLALLRLTGYLDDLSGKHPVFEMLDWIGESIPAVSEINGMQNRLGAYYSRPNDKYRRESRFTLPALKPRSPFRKQLQRLGVKTDCREAALPCVLFHWSDLHDSLVENFGVDV